MSNSLGPNPQSLPTHLNSTSQSASLDSTSRSGSNDKVEGKAFSRKASRARNIENKLQGLRSRRNARNAPRPLSNFKVSHAQPKPQVNLSRVHAQPGLQVWSNNPQTVTVKQYRGAPINLPDLQKLGNVTLLPPGNWQIAPNGAIKPFTQPLPSPLVQSPPKGVVQHFTGHARSGRSSRAPAQPAQVKAAAPIKSSYKNHELRKLINHSRVSERFHDVQKSSDRWKSKAVSVVESFKSGTSRHTQGVADLKSKHLTQIASVLDHHQVEQKKLLPTTPEDIKAQAKSQIDTLEEGMQVIAEIANSGKAHYSKDDFAALQTLSREMDAERALLVKVMDNPATASFNGKVSWNEATELVRLGYSPSHKMISAFTTLSDEDQIKPAEQFGAGKQHAVQKLTFAGAEEGDAPREYLFKADDAKDTSRYEQVVGTDKYLDKSRPRFAGRNLAAQNLQNALNMKLLPPMTMMVHDGKMGLLMNEAQGVQPFDSATKKAVDLPYDSLAKPQVSANIQKNLMDAQWLDCLTGQQDRHASNLFINPDNGAVTLIDNDQAFYPGLREVTDPEPGRKIGNWPPPWPGKPELISKETFDKLQTLEDEQLKAKLEPFLDHKEIESTLFRLKDLKLHALKLQSEGKVVDNWVTWRSPATEGNKGGQRVADFLHSTGKPQSYFNALSQLGGYQPRSVPTEVRSN